MARVRRLAGRPAGLGGLARLLSRFAVVLRVAYRHAAPRLADPPASPARRPGVCRRMRRAGVPAARVNPARSEARAGAGEPKAGGRQPLKRTAALPLERTRWVSKNDVRAVDRSWHTPSPAGGGGGGWWVVGLWGWPLGPADVRAPCAGTRKLEAADSALPMKGAVWPGAYGF